LGKACPHCRYVASHGQNVFAFYNVSTPAEVIALQPPHARGVFERFFKEWDGGVSPLGLSASVSSSVPSVNSQAARIAALQRQVAEAEGNKTEAALSAKLAALQMPTPLVLPFVDCCVPPPAVNSVAPWAPPPAPWAPPAGGGDISIVAIEQLASRVGVTSSSALTAVWDARGDLAAAERILRGLVARRLSRLAHSMQPSAPLFVNVQAVSHSGRLVDMSLVIDFGNNAGAVTPKTLYDKHFSHLPLSLPVDSEYQTAGPVGIKLVGTFRLSLFLLLKEKGRFDVQFSVSPDIDQIYLSTLEMFALNALSRFTPLCPRSPSSSTLTL
jgi:hypothetical protein